MPRPPAHARWRAARAALAALLLVTGLAACGGDGDDPPAARTDTRTAPAAREAPAPERLPVGLTEFNAQLVRPPGAGGDVDPAFARFREQATRLRPRYLRLVVDWSRVGADPSGRPDFELPQDGCIRGAPPCAPFAGVRDQLRAAREQQREGGWEVVVVITWVPEWAAAPARGCERPGTEARSRPITEKGLEAYRRLVRELVRLGEREGVPLRWWSPFNEPNHPAFISPQRRRCDVRSAPASAAVYARLVRAARAELARAGGDRRLVLGELAGVPRPSPRGSGVSEFVRALPQDVACAGDVWAQHQYVKPDGSQHDAVAELQRALGRRPCTARTPVWVTETGVIGDRPGTPREPDREALRADCRAMHEQLERWAADDRVEAAFQYTLREDPLYAVGLFDGPLTRTWPVYATWRAWSAATTEQPAPGVPEACRPSTA